MRDLPSGLVTFLFTDVEGGAPAEMMRTVDPRPAAVEAIGEAAVAEAWQEEQALTPEEAVAAALNMDG